MQSSNTWAQDIKTTHKYFVSQDDNFSFHSPHPFYLKQLQEI